MTQTRYGRTVFSTFFKSEEGGVTGGKTSLPFDKQRDKFTGNQKKSVVTGHVKPPKRSLSGTDKSLCPKEDSYPIPKKEREGRGIFLGGKA